MILSQLLLLLLLLLWVTVPHITAAHLASMAGPQAGDTLVAAALKVMLEPDPLQKAAYTDAAVKLWQWGAISK